MRIPRRATPASAGPGVSAQYVAVTCGKDGWTHYVDDVVYERGLAAASHSVVGVCGHAFVVAPLVAPPGPVCRLCRVALAGLASGVAGT